jgi:molecular chaperone GrpE
MTEEKMEEKPIEEDLEEDLEEVDAESPEEDAGPDAEPGEENAIEELKAELAAAEQAGQEYEDRFMRLYAEFENYKKRTARETKEFRKFANEALIKEMLPVIDNLERAIQSSSSHENDQEDFKSSILEGVTMTLNEILKVLDRFCVKPIDALEQPFDPNFHEAIGQEESDEFADNTVIREYQKGYLLYDRLIRPAMVVVSKAKPAPAAAEPHESNDDENDNPNCEE